MANLEDILGKKINSVKELREEIKRLQDSLVGVDGESQQFKTTSQQLAAAQDELKRVTKATTDENLAAKDSIAGMEKQYKSLYNQYKLLSDSQRKSSFGKNMANELEQLSTKLNNSKKSVGNFKDNIGRYAESASQMFSKMGGSAEGLVGKVGNLSKSFKGLGAAVKAGSAALGPVKAVLSVLIVLFAKGAQAISKNEESQMRLNRAMQAFQPIIDKVNNAFDWLGEKIVVAAEKLGKFVEKVRIATAAFTDFLGITEGRKERVEEEIKLYDGLIVAEQNLVKARRQTRVENSKQESEVERLRDEAEQTDNLAEREKLLTEAKRQQGEIDARNLAIAQEELRILQERAKLTANSTADEEKLADAEEKVNRAMATASRNARQYDTQLKSIRNSTKGVTDENKKMAQELFNTLVEENKSELLKLDEKYIKEKKLLERYHLDTTLLTKKYNKERLDIIQKAADEEFKKRRDTYNKVRTLETQNAESYNSQFEQYANPLDVLQKRIDDYQRLLGGKLQKLESMFGDIVSNAAPELQRALVSIWDTGVISDATNFETVLTEIQQKINEGGEDVEEWKETYSSLTKLGEKGWYEMLKPLQEYAQELEKTGGISLKTGTDFANSFNIVKAKLKETQGELSLLRIDEVFKNADFASLNEELDALLNGISEGDFKEIVARGVEESLNAEKVALEEELTNFKGTQEQKIELMQQYYDVVSEMRENEWALENLQRERDEKAVADTIESISSISSAFETVRGSIESIIDSEVESGKITEQQAKKKKKALLALQAVETTLNVISIAGSTASGIMKVWQSFAAEKVANAETAAATGPAAAATLAALNAKSLISAIAQTAGLAATGSANIAAAIAGTIAKSNSMNSDDGGGSVSVSPQMIDSTPYSYTRTVQTQEEEEQLNRPVWVSVQDIGSALDRVRVVEEEASF